MSELRTVGEISYLRTKFVQVLSFHQLVGERFSYVRHMKPMNQSFSICGESTLTPKWLTVWPKQNPLEKFYSPHIGLAAALLNKSRYKNLNAVAYPDRYSEKWKSHTHRHGR